MVQLVLFIVYILPLNLFNKKLPEWLCYSGFVIFGLSVVIRIVALLQLNTNHSPFPSPLNSGRLITKGAFRMSGHPIYTALIFSGLGYAIYTSSLYKVVITFILLILFYFKSIYEEKLLSRKFQEYNDYKKEHVALFDR